MTNNRVLNTTRGFTLKHKQALRAVEECACAWVEFGISVRDLSLMEALERRAQQVKVIDPLPFAELPGCIYRPTEANQAGARKERAMALAANEMVRQIAAQQREEIERAASAMSSRVRFRLATQA